MRALFCVSCADVFETYFAKYGVLIHRLCKLKLLRRFPGLAFYFFLSLLQITVRMRGILEKLLVEILRNPWACKQLQQGLRIGTWGGRVPVRFLFRIENSARQSCGFSLTRAHPIRKIHSTEIRVNEYKI